MARRAFTGTGIGWAVVVTAQAAALLLLAAPCHAQPTSVALTADGGKSVSIWKLYCSYFPSPVERMFCLTLSSLRYCPVASMHPAATVAIFQAQQTSPSCVVLQLFRCMMPAVVARAVQDGWAALGRPKST